MLHQTPDREARVSGRAFVATSAILAVFFLASVFVAMPKTVLTTNAVEQVRPVVNGFWPQGWGFFTKDPDSVALGVYAEADDHTFASVLTTPQGRPSNLFGLSRASRAQGTELAILSHYMDEANWLDCTGANDACLREALAADPVAIDNNSPVPTVCGGVILTVEKPRPWSYRNLVGDRYRIQRSAHIEARCRAGGSS